MKNNIILFAAFFCASQAPMIELRKAVTGESIGHYDIDPTQPAAAQIYELIGTEDVKLIVFGEFARLNSERMLTDPCTVQVFENPPEFIVKYGLVTYLPQPHFMFSLPPVGNLRHRERIIADGEYTHLQFCALLGNRHMFMPMNTDGSGIAVGLEALQVLIDNPDIVTVFSGELNEKEKKLFSKAMSGVNTIWLRKRLESFSRESARFIENRSWYLNRIQVDYTDVRDDRAAVLRRFLRE